MEHVSREWQIALFQTAEYNDLGLFNGSSAQEYLQAERARTGKESRAVVLGHVQRGGTPTAFDRWLATRFGLHAITAVHDGEFGTMMALRGTDIVRVPLIEGTGALKLVSPEEYAEAQVFFG